MEKTNFWNSVKNFQQKVIGFVQANSNKITLTITFIALLICVIRGLYYVEYQTVNMDEGTYLLKGKYYLEGKYQPYEQNGPITNKGVFSFWILGLSQLIFPGLYSGRVFALFLMLAMLVVLWLMIRRFSNQTWAAGIVLLFSLNGFWVSMYCRALTQSVCVALLMFSLYFLSLKNAKTWHLCVGLILAAVLTLTRQNMLPYFILALIYVPWQYGFKKAWIPIVAGVGFFLAINAMYWPEIYDLMWTKYVKIFYNFLKVIGISFTSKSGPNSDLGVLVTNRDYGIIQELQVIFNALGIYLVPIIFSFFFLVTANWKKVIKSEYFKVFALFFTSFVSLYLIHLIAIFEDNDLLYSYTSYPAFFLPVGLVAIPFCFKWMSEKGSFLKATVLVTSIIAFFTGIGLYLHHTSAAHLMFLQVPRMRNMHFLPGTTELWRFLENKFHWGYKNIELILAPSYGIMLGIAFVALCGVIWWIVRKKNKSISFTRYFVLISLVCAIILSPTNYLAGNSSTGVCEESVTGRLENIGEYLSSIIEPGSLIYWEYYSPAVLLYMDDIELFPIQLNNHFYRRFGGDKETLLKQNLWNYEIAEDWLLEADYVLLGEDAAKTWEPTINSKYSKLFDKLEITENLVPCNDRSYLHIYKSLKPEE